MKRVLLSIATLSLALVSCNKMLDKGPLDSFADSNYWSTESSVEYYANAFYNNFLGYGLSAVNGTYFATLNDNQAGYSGFRDWQYTDVKVSNNAWNDAYKEIRRANIMLNRMEGVEMSDAARGHWQGVARMMRALQYYDLVRRFGDVPLIKQELQVADKDLVFGPRVDRDEVMDYVLEDLNFAVGNIYDKINRTGWSADMARAIKAEVCLYEGTYCKYRVAADGQKAPDATRANKYLNEAKDAAAAIMGNSAYVLNDSYQANFNSVDLAGNKEMILYKHYVKDVLAHSLPDYTCSSSSQAGLTKDAFDAYLFTDGKPKATTSKNNTDISTEINAAGNIDITGLLAVRDPRLSAAVDKAIMPASHGWKGRMGRTDDVEMSSASGYGVFKYDSNDLAVGYRVETGKNYTDAPLYWLAVVYLEYAEACAELGSCTQADLNKSVNKLRARVGMPDMTVSPAADPANNMGVSNLIWEIRRERRVELMYDYNYRFWDLMRWHQLNKLDTQLNPNIKLGANIQNDVIAKDAQKVSWNAEGYLIIYPNNERTYDKKYYFYPIPTSQISIYEANGYTFAQNPGWE